MSPGQPAGPTRALRAWRSGARTLGVGLLAAAAAFVALGLLTRDEDPGRPSVLAGPPPPREAVSAGRAVFARMGCGGCHRLAATGSKGGIGPNLDERVAGHTRASLTSAIVAPSSSAGLYRMPTDYGERLSAHELDDLVSFLLDARQPQSP